MYVDSSSDIRERELPDEDITVDFYKTRQLCIESNMWRRRFPTASVRTPSSTLIRSINTSDLVLCENPKTRPQTD
ncbi:hypothetical protein M758_UG023400 [Ceratodon purpureus]|nr:hypothetical protein M758_UG023400 [Ceratodon purpureus]